MQNIIAIIWDFDKTTASMWICNKVLEFAERIKKTEKSKHAGNFNTLTHLI